MQKLVYVKQILLVIKMEYLLIQKKWQLTSGIRLGTQAATTRGFGLNEFKKVGELITKVIKGLSENYCMITIQKLKKKLEKK